MKCLHLSKTGQCTYNRGAYKVKGYKGKENQIKEIMNCITTKNYSAMRERVKLLDQNDSIIGNSNFSKIIEWLESENCEWIDKINKMLENE